MGKGFSAAVKASAVCACTANHKINVRRYRNVPLEDIEKHGIRATGCTKAKPSAVWAA